MFKEQKGVTLVALVITIIVLLILAGVSISLVVGNNGVLTQATGAVNTNQAANVKEKVTMAFAAVETKYYTEWAGNTARTRADVYSAQLENELKANGLEVTGSVTGKSATVETNVEETGYVNASDVNLTVIFDGIAYTFNNVTVNPDTGAVSMGSKVEITIAGKEAANAELK